MLENKIQSECVIWYRNNFCRSDLGGVIFSVPNELAGENKVATMQAKAMGLMAGVSDTIVILPNGELFFCEFKDAKGKQSEAQVRFEKLVTGHGFNYHLIRDIETFKKLIYDKTGKQGI
jgi:hypothetical protein